MNVLLEDLKDFYQHSSSKKMKKRSTYWYLLWPDYHTYKNSQAPSLQGVGSQRPIPLRAVSRAGWVVHIHILALSLLWAGWVVHIYILELLLVIFRKKKHKNIHTSKASSVDMLSRHQKK